MAWIALPDRARSSRKERLGSDRASSRSSGLLPDRLKAVVMRERDLGAGDLEPHLLQLAKARD
jgi:hypothetical protein